jgi:uncharacterized protein YbjQ (UPF0145 family)
VTENEYDIDAERAHRGVPRAPATWPHPTPQRQPQSRLTQALSVAQQLLENSESTWEAERRRTVEPEFFPEPPPALQTAGIPSGRPAAPPPEGTPRVRVVPHEESVPPPAENLVIDLRQRPPLRGPAPAGDVQPRYGLGRAWGAGWRESAQGWVGKDTEQPVWRPVVTTTHELSEWETDTYLGIVTSEVAVEAHGGDTTDLGDALAEGRDLAMQGLVDAALERGAHAVVGVGLSYLPFGNRIIITLRGTAVTLRDRS